MEYQGTLLDYVKHAKFRRLNGELNTVKTLYMPEDKSYTFYTASDGLAVMSGDDLSWTLTAPDAMFRFKEFATVGDFIDALIEYLPDNPVYTWDELADELTDATVLGNINAALGSGGVTVRGNTNTYTGTNIALASPDSFAAVAEWLWDICVASSGSIRSAPISEILQTGEDGRVYRLRVVGASTIAITFKLAAYIEPGKAEDDGDAVVYNYTWELYYSSLEDAIEEAEAGETLYLIRDYTLTKDVSIPVGITVIVPSNGAFSDASAGNTSHGPLRGGAAYVTLKIPAGIQVTVAGTLVVGGTQQAWYMETGCRTGAYGAIHLRGTLLVHGTLQAFGSIYGSGNVRALLGARVYEAFAILDWPGGTILRNAYNVNVWRFAHYHPSGITAKLLIKYGAQLILKMLVYANGSLNVQNINWIGMESDQSVFAIVNSESNVLVSYTDGAYTIAVTGDVSMRDLSMIVRYLFYNYTISTSGIYLPISDSLRLIVKNGGTLTIDSTMAKFLPGSSLTVKTGGTLVLTPAAELVFYDPAEYSGDYFNHYTYNPDIPTNAASLTAENGSTLTRQSGSGTANPTKTQTSTSSGSNNYYSWTLGTNTATVSGNRTNSSKAGFSQTLTLTAPDDGIISFSYTCPSYVSLSIDGSTKTSGGTFTKKVKTGATIKVSATFQKDSASSRTVTLSNIMEDLAITGIVASSDPNLANIPSSGGTVGEIAVPEYAVTPSGVIIGKVNVPAYYEQL